MNSRRAFFTLIEQLRAVGALLVVYSHLVPNFLASRNRSWVVDQAVARLVHDPLHAELNFGWPGVALFFFVSGFVVTHAASNESAPEYAVKRLLRIYPPLIVTAVLVGLMAHFGALVTGLTAAPSRGQVLLGASLANYLTWAQPAVVAVGWTLVIEMFFYMGLLATKPLLRRAPAGVTTVLLVICAAAGRLHTDFGVTFSLAAGFVAFVPLLLLGQVVYFARTSRLSPRAACLFGVACWVTFVYGMRQTSPLFADPAKSFMSNAALAFCVFLIAVLLEGKLKPFRAFAVVARRSYSLYLLHVPVGFTLLAFLVDSAKLPYPVALGIALAAVGVATELAYRFVERPSIRLARHLTAAGRARRTEPRPAVAPSPARSDGVSLNLLPVPEFVEPL